MSQEDDNEEKDKEKKLASTTTETIGSQRSRVCPNCNYSNHLEADVCARCKVIF